MKKKERVRTKGREERREGGRNNFNCNHTPCGAHEQNWLSNKKSPPKEAEMHLKMLNEALELKSTQMSIHKSLDKKSLGSVP